MGADKRNFTLDFVKGIACIFVVFIHVPFPGIVGEMISELADFAVPFFYMISGYYAYYEDGRGIEELKRKIRHILNLTYTAISVYVIFHLISSGVKVGFLNEIKNLLQIRNWLRLILLGDFNFIEAGHLWYLPCLIYSYALLLFVYKKQAIEKVKKGVPVLFALKIIVTILVESFGLSWFIKANFVISALPWICLGILLARKAKTIDIKKNKVLLLGGVGIVLSLWGVFDSLKINVSVCGTICLSVSIFLWCICFSQMASRGLISEIGRKYSSYIYLFHILVYRCVNTVCSYIVNVDEHILLQWSMPVIVVFMTGVSVLFVDVFFKTKSVRY